MKENKTRILVIDDQPSEVKMISLILESAGYKVVYVHRDRDD